MSFLKNRFVIGCFCIILACVIGFVGIPMFTNFSNQKITVVVANRDISKGDELDETMFYEHHISRGDIPYPSDKYYTVINLSGNADDVALFTQSGNKLYANRDIYANDILTTDKVTTQYPYSDMEIRTLENDHYAVSVNVSSLASGVAGKIREGDIVTMLIYSDNSSVFVDSYLNYLKVISVSNSDAVDIKDNSEDIPSVITFEVNIKQAMLLAEYNSNYGIHYALAARSDTEKAEMLINEQNKLLGEEHRLGRLEEQ